MKLKVLLAVFPLILLSCGPQTAKNEATISHTAPYTDSALYSQIGKEFAVEFQAVYFSRYKSTANLDAKAVAQEIKGTTQFLFGPLTYHSFGGVQKGEVIEPLLDQAKVQQGRLVIPYHYSGTWLLNNDVASKGSLELPLPYSAYDLRTPQWNNCTDPSEGHNDWGFFWYYWEPSRPGCDHKLGEQYQMITVNLNQETQQTTLSYPEYKRMIRMENGVPTLAMTFAFGYVEDSNKPDPFTDSDYGMTRFRRFHAAVKKQLLGMGFKERSILQGEIASGSTAIGSEFTGMKDNVQVRVSVVAAAGVDQMDIFAHSYATKHEGFFGWFGHSRVGSGFDADQFAMKLKFSPRRYSLTQDYQLLYWAGCNSYSYYTKKFFELKSALNAQIDPQGSLNLDIISNALPSLFTFNDFNASVLFKALLNWQTPTSYQSIIKTLEDHASSSGETIIINVLGDEDNNK